MPLTGSEVKSHPGHTLVAALLVAGLVFGSALHRVQHGIEYARSVQPSQQVANDFPGVSSLHTPTPLSSVDEAACVLCDVVNAQTLLAPIAWQFLDPGAVAIRHPHSAVHAESMNRASGRSPPRWT